VREIVPPEFLITNLQKYDPHTFIFDLGGSFEASRCSSEARTFASDWNPRISDQPVFVATTKENLDFLALFLKVLIQGQRTGELDPATNANSSTKSKTCMRGPGLRTLGVLANTLGHEFRAASRNGPWRTVRISLRQRRGHDFVLPLPVLRLPAYEPVPELLNRCSSTSCIGQCRHLRPPD